LANIKSCNVDSADQIRAFVKKEFHDEPGRFWVAAGWL